MLASAVNVESWPVVVVVPPAVFLAALGAYLAYVRAHKRDRDQ